MNRRIVVIWPVSVFLLAMLISSTEIVGQDRELITVNPNVKFPGINRPYRVYPEEVGCLVLVKEIFISLRAGETQTSAKIDTEGMIRLDGDVLTCDGTTVKFDSATLQLNGNTLQDLTFVTETFGGYRIEFRGQFYDEPKRRGNTFVAIYGEIRLFKNDRLTIVRDVEFRNWSEE